MTTESDKNKLSTSSDSATQEEPRVLRAVAADDCRYVQYGTPAGSMWIEKGALALNPREVFAQLQNRGITHGATDWAKAKTAISEHADFEPGSSAATRPGWHGDVYFFRDGACSSGEDARPVRFDPDRRFSPRGNLEDWQAALGRVVCRQPVFLTALATAFVGPLLKFLPKGAGTVLLELVGPPHCGKSTAALVAASVWAGDADNPLGGADSWQMTANSVDNRKARGSDGLLVWDEVNTAGTFEQQRELVRSAIFGLTSAGAKERFGDRPVLDPLCSVLISTSNSSVAERFSRASHDDRAIHSRVLTLMVPELKVGGVFFRQPAGFPTGAAAIQFLRDKIDANYGCAGRAFIQGLIATNRKKLDRRIKKWWSLMIGKAETAGMADPRQSKMLAAIYVAGKLATSMGIMGKDWGFTAARLLSAMGRSLVPSRPKAIRRFERYLAKYKRRFLKVEAAPADMTREKFRRLRGLTRATTNGTELLIPVPAFLKAFRNDERLARELRDLGVITSGKGTKSKISIHAPRRFKNGVRMYRILLDQLNAGEASSALPAIGSGRRRRG